MLLMTDKHFPALKRTHCRSICVTLARMSGNACEPHTGMGLSSVWSRFICTRAPRSHRDGSRGPCFSSTHADWRLLHSEHSCFSLMGSTSSQTRIWQLTLYYNLNECQVNCWHTKKKVSIKLNALDRFENGNCYTKLPATSVWEKWKTEGELQKSRGLTFSRYVWDQLSVVMFKKKD